MSNKLRNPFLMRASERIETDVNFLRLYSPVALDNLIDKNLNDSLWNNVVFIRSSPGGGKTSLLRIFEPVSLSTIYYSRQSPDNKDLFNSLYKLRVLNEEGISTLAVYLSCNKNYDILEDLSLNEGQKKRLFFALLNSRITLATLLGLLELKKLKYPDDLKKIKFVYKNEGNYYKNIKTPCFSDQLHQWALKTEEKIYTLMDSLLPIPRDKIEGHDELFSLITLNPDYFLYKGQPICNKILFMFDDVHKLSITQRQLLIRYAIETRGKFNIWFSERLEALNPKENIGAIKIRDYEEINLEEIWQNRPSKFEKIIANIADKRARASTEEVNTFQENLFEYIDIEENESKLAAFNEQKKQELVNLANSFSGKFDNWIDYLEKYKGNPLDKAIIIKKIQILMHRSLGKSQLAFDFPLSAKELEEKLEQNIDEIAKFFLFKEVGLPCYFGFNNLVKISNNNIEQFLGLASGLFEEMLSAKIIGNTTLISAKTQEDKIDKVISEYWDDLGRRLPNGNIVKLFLNKFAEFATKETYKINAPIAQGVSGFSISQPRQNQLFDNSKWYDLDYNKPLLEIISTCVANNLLESREIIQGAKGQKNQVFYLNRWLCVKFNLPLQYGGWKHKNVQELLNWIKI